MGISVGPRDRSATRCQTLDCRRQGTVVMVGVHSDVGVFCRPCANYLSRPPELLPAHRRRFTRTLRTVSAHASVAGTAVLVVPLLVPAGWIALAGVAIILSAVLVDRVGGHPARLVGSLLCAIAGLLVAATASAPIALLGAATCLIAAGTAGLWAMRWYESHTDPARRE